MCEIIGIPKVKTFSASFFDADSALTPVTTPNKTQPTIFTLYHCVISSVCLIVTPTLLKIQRYCYCTCTGTAQETVV